MLPKLKLGGIVFHPLFHLTAELRESGDGFEGGYGEMKLEYPNCVFPGSGIGMICMFPAGSRLSSRGGSLQAVRLRFDPSDSFLVSLCLTPARRQPGRALPLNHLFSAGCLSMNYLCGS